MKIKPYVQKKPVTALKDNTIRQVARKMRDKKVGTIIIVESNEPVGLITDRDIVTRVVAMDVDPKTTTVDSIMTKKPYIVKENDQVGDVYHKLLRNEWRIAPVIKTKKLCGIVTMGALAKAIEDQMMDAYFGRQDFSGRY